MSEAKVPEPDPEDLTGKGYVFAVLSAVAIALGMTLLWTMEIVRNAVFWLLDRLHISPKGRVRAAAYPPSPKRN
jgi:hypothetical protein